MNVTLKINEKNEILFDKKWQQFDKNFFYKNFPNIKKLVLKRTCHNKKYKYNHKKLLHDPFKKGR